MKLTNTISTALLVVTATQALPVQPGAGSKSEVFARSAPTIDDTVLQHSKPGAEISLIMPRDVGEAHEDTSELQRRRLSSFFTSSRKGFKRLEKLTEEDSVGGTTSLSDSPSLASVENTLDEAVAPISWEDLEKDKWGYPLADTPIDVLPEHMQREVRQKYGHWYNAKIRTDQSGSYHYEGWPWPKPKVSEEAAETTSSSHNRAEERGKSTRGEKTSSSRSRPDGRGKGKARSSTH